MKLIGGEWSRGDIIALLALAVGAIGVVPILQGWLSLSQSPSTIRMTKEVKSGQLNVGCGQDASIETPEILFGKDPRDIDAQASWINTDKIKSSNQGIDYIADKSSASQLNSVKAHGNITGLDFEFLNCPGGGHGTLDLRVSWTEDK